MVHGGVPCLGERAQRLERAHHAERAVEPAAVRHGVDVRADHDGLGARCPRSPAQTIAGLVDLDLDG